MGLPFFYIEQFNNSQSELLLNEDTSKHMVQVLRMKTGEQLHLTDGEGNLLLCSIIDSNKKHCLVKVESKTFRHAAIPRVSIAISLLKNSNRFEWFLEKATELGINEIFPLICERTEKEKFRRDRLKQICISAMLQSQQTWLPDLHDPVLYKDIINETENDNKFIAHCIESTNRSALYSHFPFKSSIILIGPEGDFTPVEVALALEKNFIPVTLGHTRLRTETAAICAAVILTSPAL